jgi:hypothetical protein
MSPTSRVSSCKPQSQVMAVFGFSKPQAGHLMMQVIIDRRTVEIVESESGSLHWRILVRGRIDIVMFDRIAVAQNREELLVAVVNGVQDGRTFWLQL